MREFLSSYEIPYKEVNVEESREARKVLLNKTGHEMVPALITKNNDVIIGYDEARLKEIFT